MFLAVIRSGTGWQHDVTVENDPEILDQTVQVGFMMPVAGIGPHHEQATAFFHEFLDLVDLTWF